eukprot:gb/GEZJ01006737.1/.p1 GENE.gb/GEZJ01006737.1/~~gb/GEZJ01006737.1/.p1  ORF type:complete len:108 (+),score=7.36 gb/GEZJ01006737.1/:169-492(+)
MIIIAPPLASQVFSITFERMAMVILLAQASHLFEVQVSLSLYPSSGRALHLFSISHQPVLLFSSLLSTTSVGMKSKLNLSVRLEWKSSTIIFMQLQTHRKVSKAREL